VADHVLEVGPGLSGLPRPQGEDPGEGPLPAIALAAGHLRRVGLEGPALVLATDLPLLSAGLLAAIATWPEPAEVSVVPLRGGRPQTLCARWSPAALSAAEERSAAGERRVQAAFEGNCRFLTESDLPGVDLERELADVDEPGTLRRLGLELPGEAAERPPGIA
jgi:molybdopterin-guanine dinucleotide biosynthesis protein A